MSKKIDYGKIIDQRKIKILENDDANKLYDKITKNACSQIPILFNKLMLFADNCIPYPSLRFNEDFFSKIL